MDQQYSNNVAQVIIWNGAINPWNNREYWLQKCWKFRKSQGRCIKIKINKMKTIEQQKDDQQQHFVSNQLPQVEEDNTEKLSMSASCASANQDSIEEGRKGRYYASFSFRFKSTANSDRYEFLSDGEQMRMEEFFDDEVIFEKKVQKREIVFRPGCLNSKFIKLSTEPIFKFCQAPDETNFAHLLEQISAIEAPIFEMKSPPSYSESESQPPEPLSPLAGGQVYTINQALEDLFYRKEHTYLVYTFDWSICHLSFVCCLLIYWLQIELGSAVEEGPVGKSKQEYIDLEKTKLKQNVCYITLSYAEQRSQQINTHQPVLLLLYNFLNYLKRQPCLNIVEISRIQDKLVEDIKLFRRIKRKEKEFSSPSNEIIVQSQLRKYELENKLITSLEKTYVLLNLLCSHNFVSWPLLKYYQLDQYRDSRHHYQAKKDSFCLWVLGIVLHECQGKAADSLHHAALYVLTFMGILKRMNKQSNMEGLSYMVPILANIQIYLPRLWKYVKERRPEIEKRLSEYTARLTRKEFKTGELLQGSSIIWNETIYEMTEKMQKFLSTQEFIQLEEHKKFYEQFLVHFLHYRRDVQKEYREEILKYDKEKEIGSSFNMYLLDSHVPRLYEGKCLEQEWARFARQAELVNGKISVSLYSSFINYCFVGSTAKFQKMDI